MDSLKRKGPEDVDAAPAADEPFSQFKRPRSTALAVVEQPVQSNGALTVFESGAQSKAVVQHRNFNMPMRTSSLEAPTMLLEGHKGHVYGCAFDSTGNSLASCSFDKSVLLWNLRGSISSYASLVGHKGAVLDVHWSADDEHILTASSDKTAALFDAFSGTRIKRIKDHSSYVNSCVPSRAGDRSMMLTASDDCTARLYDVRARACVHKFDCEFPVLSADFAADNSRIFTAGIEESIRVWDLRMNSVVMTLDGHMDTVTGISVSPDGSYLLSNSADNTLRAFDIRPFATGDRTARVFQGHQHNFEKLMLRCNWSSDGSRVSAGSADRFVYVWDFDSRRMLYKLPGHSGAVTQVAFQPDEPVIASCSQDGKIYIGEISP